MEGRGMSYYQMHRGWMNSPVFRKSPYSHREAWCWLIENAAWAKSRIPVEGGILTLERGQLSHSLRFLAKAWKWQSDKRVRLFLRRLEEDKMLRIQKGRKTDAGKDAGQNVITICNYERYQAPQTQLDAPLDAGWTQQGRKEKEDKEESRSDAKSVKAILFDDGLSWLAGKTGKTENSFRSLMGKWIKNHGEEPVAMAIMAAQKDDPVDPVPWIEGRFKNSKIGGFQAPPAWASEYAPSLRPRDRNEGEAKQ
jgi:hypothetical protein